jgi:hypothetical protein
MKRRVVAFVMIGLAGLVVFMNARADGAAELVGRWDFNVFINDKKVGEQYFEVTQIDGLKRVQTEASFKYRIFFIPAYSFEHTNSELWSDNCLVQFDSDTNANGKRTVASGKMDGSGFIVEGKEGLTELPHCVMTFAYWNPVFLKQERLLNPQSGEYLDVTVEELTPMELDVNGEAIAASRYKITAKELSLVVWYSDDFEWLALESEGKGGRIIRYELT